MHSIGVRNPSAKITFLAIWGARRRNRGGARVGYAAYAPQISARLSIPMVNVFSLDSTSTLL